MKEEIIKYYVNGLSNKKISELFNIHRTTVQRILKKNNIPIRKQDETSRLHNIINFTGDILSNNDAYILGMIYSDGNLSKNCIEISLQEQDKELLESISKYIYSKINLQYRQAKEFKKDNVIYNQKSQYRFLLCSKSVCNKLRTLGLSENKSLKIRFPNIPEEFHSHFIRGVFDGDGCIHISNKYKGNNRITIVSNYKFCNDLKDIVKKHLNINISINNKNENVGIFSISGNKQVKTFMDWIYDKSDLKMNRKWKKFMKNYYQQVGENGTAIWIPETTKSVKIKFKIKKV